MAVPPILLVHGAWHGAWCWAPLLDSLERRAMPALAIDLPGHGERRKPSWFVSWGQYLDAVCDAAASFERPPMVVGHSMGGGVITAAAERAPHLFHSLVYVTAFVPKQGETIAALAKSDVLKPPVKGRLTRGEAYFERDDAAATFFHDCPQPDRWSGLVQPQAIRPVTAAIQATEARIGHIPRHYVCCDRDRALSPAFQQRMIARTPMRSVFHMDCGHSPFIADPERLADILAEIRDGAATPPGATS